MRGSTITTSNRRSPLEKSLNAEAIDIFKPLTFKVPIKNSGKKTLQVESNNDSTGALGECAARSAPPGKSWLQIFVKEFAIPFQKPFNRAALEIHIALLCPPTLLRRETRNERTEKRASRTWLLSTSGIFASVRHYQRVLARIICQSVCAERDNSHAMEATLRRTRSSIMRNATSYRRAAARRRSTIEISTYHRAPVAMILSSTF